MRHLAALISDGAKGGRVWHFASAVAANVAPSPDRGTGWAVRLGGSLSSRVRHDGGHRLTTAGAGGFRSTPRSSSMPSSHTAGAVAYVAAAGLRSPAMGIVVLPMAGAVGWSRTATARHFPTDVAAGAAVGVLVGIATHTGVIAAEGRRADPGPPGLSEGRHW